VIVLGYQGEHKEGEAKYRHALELDERVLDQEHLETLKNIKSKKTCSHLKVPFRSNPTNLLYSHSVKCPLLALRLPIFLNVETSKEGFRLRRKSSKYMAWKLESLLTPIVPSIGSSHQANSHRPRPKEQAVGLVPQSGQE
jgi:hypothetical protein